MGSDYLFSLTDTKTLLPQRGVVQGYLKAERFVLKSKPSKHKKGDGRFYSTPALFISLRRLHGLILDTVFVNNREFTACKEMYQN